MQLRRLPLIYQPWKDGRLNWPSWLTHRPVNRRSGTSEKVLWPETDVLTTEPPHQPSLYCVCVCVLSWVLAVQWPVCTWTARTPPVWRVCTLQCRIRIATWCDCYFAVEPKPMLIALKLSYWVRCTSPPALTTSRYVDCLFSLCQGVHPMVEWSVMLHINSRVFRNKNSG